MSASISRVIDTVNLCMASGLLDRRADTGATRTVRHACGVGAFAPTTMGARRNTSSQRSPRPSAQLPKAGEWRKLVLAIRRRITGYDDSLFHRADPSRQRQHLPRLLGSDARTAPNRAVTLSRSVRTRRDQSALCNRPSECDWRLDSSPATIDECNFARGMEGMKWVIAPWSIYRVRQLNPVSFKLFYD